MQALFFSPFWVIKQHGQATFTPFVATNQRQGYLAV
jgi:hypothetical protein